MRSAPPIGGLALCQYSCNYFLFWPVQSRLFPTPSPPSAPPTVWGGVTGIKLIKIWNIFLPGFPVRIRDADEVFLWLKAGISFLREPGPLGNPWNYECNFRGFPEGTIFIFYYKFHFRSNLFIVIPDVFFC